MSVEQLSSHTEADLEAVHSQRYTQESVSRPVPTRRDYLPAPADIHPANASRVVDIVRRRSERRLSLLRN